MEVVDIKLKEGQCVELGDRQFEVIHAPGHTPGNICLLQREDHLLIVGDTLCGEAVNYIRMDKRIYINSIKRLLELDIKLLIQSHPREPFKKGNPDWWRTTGRYARQHCLRRSILSCGEVFPTPPLHQQFYFAKLNLIRATLPEMLECLLTRHTA